MSEIYHRYQSGESIPASDLNTDAGLRLYGEVIFYEWKIDHATSQPDLWGEVYIQKVHPIEPPLTPEQIHLKRPPDTREGRRQAEYPTEEQRILEVRKQLENVKLS